jgi:cell division septum initiation protein DivIVA
MEDGGGSDPGHGLDPEGVEEIDFAKVRRGYEPDAVRTRLREAAEEIRRLNALVGSLSDRVTELEATPPETLESRRVAEALGDEATRVLQSASDAAQVQIERAEAEHARIVGEAEAAAAAIAEEGRERGRNMVVEAQSVRERILADLARKRHEHRVAVEQLRVTRDRLLEALGVFRRGLDGWIEELVQAEPRAAAAAEQAGQRVAAQPESTVAELEAEISAARLAGMTPEGGSGEGAPAPHGAAAQGPADSDADADTTPGEEREVAEAGTAADAAEPGTPVELDEPEAVGEYVDLEGLTIEPLPAPAPAAVRLYDVEAEAEAAFDAGADPLQEQASEAPDDAVAAASEESEPAAEAPPPGAEAIFARLRSITSQPVGEPEPRSAEPGVTDSGATSSAGAPEPVDGFADEPDELADEFADGLDDGSGAATVPADPDDLVGAARAVAVGGIARRLKRLVVDEQGDLLDAVRRNGVRAVRSTITSDTRAYRRVVRVPMQDFASDIDVSIDDVDLEAAGSAILSALVEPVRERLGELIESTDDPDELTTAVRSIYRESRSRRADTAAETAFSAGWPEPIS